MTVNSEFSMELLNRGVKFEIKLDDRIPRYRGKTVFEIKVRPGGRCIDVEGYYVNSAGERQKEGIVLFNLESNKVSIDVE